MLTGTLHILVAFDWGDEIDLGRVRQLVPAQTHALPRRRRTPTSIAYQPPPLQLALPAVPLELPELGAVQAGATATVFDFAAVSIGLRPARPGNLKLARPPTRTCRAQRFTDWRCTPTWRATSASLTPWLSNVAARSRRASSAAKSRRTPAGFPMSVV